jgi:hypothetical protein
MRCCAPSVSTSFHVTRTSRLRDETPQLCCPRSSIICISAKNAKEAYLALLELVGKENSSGASR